MPSDKILYVIRIINNHYGTRRVIGLGYASPDNIHDLYHNDRLYDPYYINNYYVLVGIFYNDF